VTGGVAAAIDQAQATAGGRDVVVMGAFNLGAFAAPLAGSLAGRFRASRPWPPLPRPGIAIPGGGRC
jgi:hypothetical protein